MGSVEDDGGRARESKYYFKLGNVHLRRTGILLILKQSDIVSKTYRNLELLQNIIVGQYDKSWYWSALSPPAIREKVTLL